MKQLFLVFIEISFPIGNTPLIMWRMEMHKEREKGSIFLSFCCNSRKAHSKTGLEKAADPKKRRDLSYTKKNSGQFL